MSQRKCHYLLNRLLTSIEAFQQLKKVQPHLKWIHGGQSCSVELLSTNGPAQYANTTSFAGVRSGNQRWMRLEAFVRWWDGFPISRDRAT